MKDSFFTLTFFPRKPRSAGSGEYPLYARITTEGQKVEFTIGRKVNPSVWDQRAQRSNGRSRRDIELNKYLEMVRSRFYEIHNLLINEGQFINPQIMKNHYLGMVEKPKMLCDVFRETNIKRREEYERGDIGYATFSRWERCVTYLEELPWREGYSYKRCYGRLRSGLRAFSSHEQGMCQQHHRALSPLPKERDTVCHRKQVDKRRPVCRQAFQAYQSGALFSYGAGTATYNGSRFKGVPASGECPGYLRVLLLHGSCVHRCSQPQALGYIYRQRRQDVDSQKTRENR